MPLFDFTQYNCRSLLVFGLSFWKLAEVPLEELYLSANPQLGAYGAEVSHYSWPSLRVLDMSQCNVTEAGCFCAMPVSQRSI